MSTLDLAEFLLARIAEDEAEAEVARYEYVPDGLWSAARVLAECEAKRNVVELERQHVRQLSTGRATGQAFPGVVPRWLLDAEKAATLVLGDALKLLALPYASHPDYRQEWKP